MPNQAEDGITKTVVLGVVEKLMDRYVDPATVDDIMDKLTVLVDHDEQVTEILDSLVMTASDLKTTTTIVTNNVKRGSETIFTVANGCVSITGFGLACTSLGKCFTAKNWFARAAYIGSISCGSGAAVASGLTTIKQDTWFNPYGFLSAGGSYILLRLGNQLHDTGRMLEGKQPRSIFRLPRNTVNSGKTAFTPIQHISTDSIPYSKIFNGCVLVITIYTYSQFVIASYRFTQRLVNKFKQQRKSKQIRKAAKCLIQSSSILKKYSYQRILVYS